MKKEKLRPCSFTYNHNPDVHFNGLFHKWFESNIEGKENILFAIVELDGAVTKLDMNYVSLIFTD